MKTTIKLSALKAMVTAFLCGIVMVCSVTPLMAQTVEYNYDASGNIISRKVIVLTAMSSVQDSITHPRVFEDTRINVRLYPDYVLGQLKVEVPDYNNDETLLFRLRDMEGRLLLSTQGYEACNNFDIGRFDVGACILDMSRNGKYSSWHIVKTN